VFVAALLWMVLPTVSAQVAKAFLVTVGSLLAVGVGLSRVYLGYHWFSDVLGAWLIATIWIGIACLGLAALRRRPGHQDGRDADRHVRLKDPTPEQEVSDDHAPAHARFPGHCP
jgi:undecaprenyl-diphosphatase